VRHHHERWDGAGYPDGLQGEAILIAARIVGLVDAFDAMVHDRPFRPAMTIDEALGEIRRAATRQFDPVLVESFLELVEQPARSAVSRS
jgi:HD-GYP domain-containing protein (c-di-GMP phosphodiesterase class II)